MCEWYQQKTSGRVRYTPEAFDSELGFLYSQARASDRSPGRWLSSEPPLRKTAVAPRSMPPRGGRDSPPEGVADACSLCTSALRELGPTPVAMSATRRAANHVANCIAVHGPSQAPTGCGCKASNE
jgi:hypothetical protein